MTELPCVMDSRCSYAVEIAQPGFLPVMPCEPCKEITADVMNMKSETSDRKQRYRIFDHTADLGLEIYGEDVKELFLNAAIALFDIVTDMDRIDVAVTRRFEVNGLSREDLLVNFMREILYIQNGEGLVLKEVSLSEMSDSHVKGQVGGEVFDPKKHSINMEIKAVTYHQALVRKTPGGWKGRIICDV